MANKMNTPDYILEIRKGNFTMEGAVNKMLNESGIKSFPINVWNIARNLNFEVFDAAFKDNNTSGMMVDALEVPSFLASYTCKRAIVLNKNEDRNMQSFTIAHELGHFVYDCNEDTNYYDAFHFSRSGKELDENDKAKKEREDRADKFAAMLLMPEIMFRDYISNSKNRKNREKLKKEMAIVCMVPEDAVNRRFDELQIAF